MCDYPHCQSEPTRNFRCTVCGYELFLCDTHGPPNACFTCKSGIFNLYRRLQQVTQKNQQMEDQVDLDEVVQSVVDNRIEIEEIDLEEVEETTTSCGLRGTQELAWCESTDDLALRVEVCKNVHVSIGHSFGAMALRETYLRDEAGTTVKNGVASGPNNAICELRILLVNERCESLQIAVRFRDTDSRFLLFRSTGGCVLQQDPQDVNKALVRTHTCKCKASDGYQQQETYAHVGSYSFFDQIEDAYDEPRLMGAEPYMKHHEGDYRQIVEASDNPQLYHHSEQAIFKLLYDYPNVVADAILEVLTKLKSGFFKNLKKPLVLAALVLDIFTTRTACVDCLKAGKCARTKSVHFFAQALKDVGKTLAGKVDVAENVRTHIRLAAAVAFLGCPSKESLKKQEKTTTSSMIHALPSENIQVTSLSEEEPAIVFVNVAVPANSQSCMQLLTTGSASRERTEVDRALRLTKQLSNITKVSQIPGAVSKSLLEQAPSKLLMALRLYVKLEPKSGDVAFLYEGGLDVVPLAPRLECIMEVAAENDIAPDEILYTVLRNYRAFFDGQRNMPKPFDAAGLLGIIDSALRAIYKLDAVSKNAKSVVAYTGLAISKRKQELAKRFLKEIKKEIKEALAQETATGENRALNLAIEFNLLDFYKDAKKG